MLRYCARLAQSVVESARGEHDQFVFVHQRRKTDGNARGGRPDWAPCTSDVHDLRHTSGMRSREAGVGESTRADILWHTSPTMTHHYSTALIIELHEAVEKVKDDTGRWNKSLATPKLE